MQPIDIGLHTEGDGGEMFRAVCKLGLEDIVSKRINAPLHGMAGGRGGRLMDVLVIAFGILAAIWILSSAGSAVFRSKRP